MEPVETGAYLAMLRRTGGLTRQEIAEELGTSDGGVEAERGLLENLYRKLLAAGGFSGLGLLRWTARGMILRKKPEKILRSL